MVLSTINTRKEVGGVKLVELVPARVPNFSATLQSCPTVQVPLEVERCVVEPDTTL
jgi:hypothetical protein